MTSNSVDRSVVTPREGWVVWLLLALFFAGLVALGPWWNVYELDQDEGINLMKGALVAAGHPLYAEVWSDQPPFLSILLAGLVKLFGPSVMAARIMILGFAGLALFSLFRVVRRSAGVEAAVLATILVATGSLFLRLSVSVMIGLPAIALALLALDLAISGRSRDDAPGRALIAVSAIVMALSLMTKLFTATMLPMLLLALIIERGPSAAPRQQFVALWVAVLAAVLAAFAAIGGGTMLDQLIAPHETARGADAFRYEGGPQRFVAMMAQHPQFPIVGAIGLIVGLFHDRRRLLLPLVWLVVAGLALLWHRPLWSHHLLLVIIPLAWLGGLIAVPLGDLMSARSDPERQRPGLGAVLGMAGTFLTAIVAAAVFALPRIAVVGDDFHTAVAKDDTAAVVAMKAYAPQTRWVVTDRPIDAFRADLLSVPPLAVLTRKRLRAGLLRPAEIVQYIEEYRPEQVAIRRMSLGKPVLDYLRKNYSIAIREMRLYLAPSLNKKNI